MNDEYSINDTEVTLCEDGFYRWLYVMDMGENKSMLCMLMRIFGLITVGAGVFWFLLMRGSSYGDHFFSMFFIWILIIIGVEALVYIGYMISRKVMKDTYPIRFEMDDNGISIFQSEKIMARRKSGYQGRKDFSDVVSETAFSTVLGISTSRQWDLIDLTVIGGKFQVYVGKRDYDLVLDHILKHVPERVRNNYR